MKIAFVYDVPYPWHKGGIEHILATEAEELAKEHEVHFFTLRWPGMSNDFIYKNIHYHCYGDATEENVYRHGRRSIREALSFSIYSWKLLKYKFDFVITDQFPILHLFPLRVYRVLRNSRLIIRIDEVWDHKYWNEYLGQFLGTIANGYSNYLAYSRNATYITNSQLNVKKLINAKIKNSKIRLFAPVVDSENIEKSIKNVKKERKVIFAGRFIKEKRIDKWLEIFKRVVKEDPTINGVIIGNGIEKDKIQKMVTELKLDKNVRIKSFYKDKKELYRELAASSVFLQMSEREGLSIIVLESLQCNTPVVLPQYTPIPSEVSSMCIIKNESEIPRTILNIINKDNVKIDSTKLNFFSSKGVLSFYDELFQAIKKPKL